ncbi:MAG: hypothetical protein IT205_04905, partial [Fimbriimonadaceae bacterium]|nr:hypothetical protein [Fimbriimonadaceae bacterium]
MLHDRLLEAYLCDNTNSWLELSDGEYERVPDAGFSAQEALIKIPFTELQF